MLAFNIIYIIIYLLYPIMYNTSKQQYNFILNNPLLVAFNISLSVYLSLDL